MKAIRFSPWFWEVVESLGGDAGLMRQRFAAMPRRRLLAFCQQYDKAKAWVHPLNWRDLPLGACPDLSEDFGDDFAAWVVSRGRRFFSEARRHPKDIRRYLDEFDAIATAFESCRPDSVAFTAFRERFGQAAQELF